jgi:hypothetical protein
LFFACTLAPPAPRRNKKSGRSKTVINPCTPLSPRTTGLMIQGVSTAGPEPPATVMPSGGDITASSVPRPACRSTRSSLDGPVVGGSVDASASARDLPAITNETMVTAQARTRLDDGISQSLAQ